MLYFYLYINMLKNTIIALQCKKKFTSTNLFESIPIIVNEFQSIPLKDYLLQESNANNFETSVICNILSKKCSSACYFETTKTILISDVAVGDVVKVLEEGILKDLPSSVNKINFTSDTICNFFNGSNKILVQPTGLEGTLFQIGTIVESGATTAFTSKALILSKTAGVSVSTAFKAQPLLFIAIPTSIGIGLHACAFVVGDNVAGKVLATGGTICLFPLKIAEISYNHVLSPLLNHTLGIKTWLNFTEQVSNGTGINLNDALKLIKTNKNSLKIRILTYVQERISNYTKTIV
jgi:hypothetical protein